MQIAHVDLLPTPGHLVINSTYVPPALKEYYVKLWDGSPNHAHGTHLTNVLDALNPHTGNSSLKSAMRSRSSRMIEIRLDRNGSDTDKLMDLIIETLESNGADPNQKARAAFNIPAGIASQLPGSKPATQQSFTTKIAGTASRSNSNITIPVTTTSAPPAAPAKATDNVTQVAEQTFQDKTLGWVKSKLAGFGLTNDDEIYLSKAENVGDLEGRLYDIAKGSNSLTSPRQKTPGVEDRFPEIKRLFKEYADGSAKKTSWAEDHKKWLADHKAELKALEKLGLPSITTLEGFTSAKQINELSVDFTTQRNPLASNPTFLEYKSAAKGFGTDAQQQAK